MRYLIIVKKIGLLLLFVLFAWTGMATESFYGRVSEMRAFRTPMGRINTEVTLVALDQKSSSLTITVEGGILDGVAERHGDSPRFVIGQTGQWTQNGATGSFVWIPDIEKMKIAGGDPDVLVPLWYDSRFTACDRAEPILYRVDTNALPIGVSPERALQAVATAFSAWDVITSLRFQFDGCENFGNAAPNLDKRDGRIWIQLHNYGSYIPTGTILGQGGYACIVDPGAGARVISTEFYPTTWGYVILKHDSSFFANNPTNLEEVLTHEIGHVLALDHSIVTDSIMRSTAYGSNRGARLGGDDPQRIVAIYPTNTPPYGADRILNVITRSSAQITPAPGTNGVLLTVYDLQSTNLTIEYLDKYESGGTFNLSGSKLGFTPSGYSSGGVDPDSGSYYSRYRYRISDTVNKSPVIDVRVTAFLPDGDSDFLPDSWESLYSGLHASGAGGDKDGDGFTNYQEWMLGTSPTNATGVVSGLKSRMFAPETMMWTAKPYELYEVTATTNLNVAFSFYRMVVPTTTTGMVQRIEQDTTSRFFKVRRVP